MNTVHSDLSSLGLLAVPVKATAVALAVLVGSPGPFPKALMM